MQTSEALRALTRRTRNRVLTWIIAGLAVFDCGGFLFGMWASRHLPGMPMVIPFRPTEMVFGVIWPFLLLWISPWAWQWSGDDRAGAPVGRALLQAMAMWVPWWVVRITPGLPILRASLAPVKVPGLLPIALGFSFFTGFAIFALVGFAITTWERQVAGREAARTRAKEAQWALLKGQMSPHVLLNSLGGLAELVREDVDAAVKGMRDLADIYRQLLEMGDKPLVPLRAERALLERYLAVEQLRLGDTLRVEWEWDGGMDDHLVMPLLIQPLVENALKHGIAASPGGGCLRILASERADGWRLGVWNTGVTLGQGATRGTGVGLENLKARLQLAFGETARMTLHQEGPWVQADILLPRGPV
jgi:hypothetical protein